MTTMNSGTSGRVITAFQNDEEVSAERTWHYDDGKYQVTAAGPWGSITGHAADVFSALVDARSRPGRWAYAIDPACGAKAGVPGWAVQGDGRSMRRVISAEISSRIRGTDHRLVHLGWPSRRTS